jgi:hypothetical protein
MGFMPRPKGVILIVWLLDNLGEQDNWRECVAVDYLKLSGFGEPSLNAFLIEPFHRVVELARFGSSKCSLHSLGKWLFWVVWHWL